MSIRPGALFGAYEIVDRVGAGGMGEVYRARDPRLGREVAIKILPEEVSGNRDRLRRFEQEARSASQLNHPNIVTIYEVGEANGVSYFAMELVDGRTLRDVLVAGSLPVKKAVHIAAQIADGLAAAHEHGVVHRDIKPENVIVARSGLAKILDFGLLKLAAAAPAEDATMRRELTEPGVVVGTAGYMSPEQAAGRTADARSDQFSLGSVMYEMLTGHRPFHKATSAETMAAILREEPKPLPADVPLPLRWIVERCLAKEPEERYASTRDLARDLQRLRDVTSDTALSALAPATRSARRRPVLWMLGAVVLAAFAALAAWRYAGPSPLPMFHRITFRRGALLSARFAPDGHTILYGAAWEGQPFRTFSVREENPESAPLSLPDGDVQSISRSGELLVSLGRHFREYFATSGNLARSTLTGGGAPRDIAEDIECADWLPDGNSIAVVRNVGASSVVEFPLGKPLYRSNGYISHLRAAPDGTSVAFIDHPIRGDDRGAVTVLDRAGKRHALTKVFDSAQGLSWRPDGKEIWFTAADTGLLCVLRAVTLGGKQRVLYRAPSRLILQDIAADGRLLVTSEIVRVGTMVLAPGATHERDLAWLDVSIGTDLSADGKKVLMSEQGEGAGGMYSVYIRGTDGAPAVRISDGFGWSISPDGRYVLATNFHTQPQKLTIVTTGAGTPVTLPLNFDAYIQPGWLPDSKRIYFRALRGSDPPGLYAADPATGNVRLISSEKVPGDLNQMPITPDGSRIAMSGSDRVVRIYPVAGGPPEVVRGAEEGDHALEFSDDGRSLFVTRVGHESPTIYRVDLTSGNRSVWRRLSPPDPFGIIFAAPFTITGDGQSYGYASLQSIGDLYVVSGIR